MPWRVTYSNAARFLLLDLLQSYLSLEYLGAARTGLSTARARFFLIDSFSFSGCTDKGGLYFRLGVSDRTIVIAFLMIESVAYIRRIVVIFIRKLR